jgi:hypothetical protein
MAARRHALIALSTRHSRLGAGHRRSREIKIGRDQPNDDKTKSQGEDKGQMDFADASHVKLLFNGSLVGKNNIRLYGRLAITVSDPKLLYGVTHALTLSLLLFNA